MKTASVSDFTRGNPTRLILRFYGPLLLTSMLQQLYNFVDTMIVGKGLGDNALAAVGNMGSIFFMVIGFSLGLSNGFGLLIAQSFGAKNMELLRRKRVIEQSYLYLTNRREENNLLQSSYALPARTVDPPQANPIADSPRLSRVGMAAIFFGLAIPFCIFLLIVILRDPNFVTRFRDLDISK